MNGFMISTEGQAIAVISAGLAFMSIIVRKMVLDQEKLKKQKEETKELQKQMKEAQKAGDTKKMGEMYSKLMDVNSQVMKQSFKPMLFTLIPFLLIFTWMRSNYDYTITDVAVVNPLPEGVKLEDVNLSSDGFYNQTAGIFIWRQSMVVPGNGSTLNAEFALEDNGEKLEEPAVMYYKSATGNILQPIESNSTNGIVLLKTMEKQEGKIKITLFYNNTKSNIVAIVGGFDLGWLGWYFVCSMAASMVLNKIFKVV